MVPLEALAEELSALLRERFPAANIERHVNAVFINWSAQVLLMPEKRYVNAVFINWSVQVLLMPDYVEVASRYRDEFTHRRYCYEDPAMIQQVVERLAILLDD